MAGEMSQSEVTPEAYPALFELQAELAALGIESEPRAFDQYQGPYLDVYGPHYCKVWLAPVMGVLIERSHLKFETKGAHKIIKGDLKSVRHGYYTVQEAAKRIAKL